MIYMYPNGLYLVLAYLCVIESFENMNSFSVLEKQCMHFICVFKFSLAFNDMCKLGSSTA